MPTAKVGASAALCLIDISIYSVFGTLVLLFSSVRQSVKAFVVVGHVLKVLKVLALLPSSDVDFHFDTQSTRELCNRTRLFVIFERMSCRWWNLISSVIFCLGRALR